MPTASPQQGFDPGLFRHVIGHFMSGVAVITTREGDADHGMTASAVSSLSLEPPMLLVCLHGRSVTQEAIHRSGRFGVSILEQGQGSIAERFATPRPDKFADVAFHYGGGGQPLLDDALACLECEVVESVVGGTHRVFLGAVRQAAVRAGAPLAYYRGRFGRLEIAADDDALRRLRRIVLLRELALDTTLDPVVLSATLEVPETSMTYALTHLASEGLVERGPAGYTQTPLDAATADAAFEAKLVIDLGSARLVVERADDAALAELSGLAAETAPRGDLSQDVDELERYVDANDAFHERVIALARNPSLVDAYRRLRLPGIMSQVHVAGAADADALAREHAVIADGLRARDRSRVEDVMTAHNAHGRNAHHEAIVLAGGWL